ncbi:MAG: YeeE/YedE family protein [Paracoccaceae bacterium]|nr:YeeE/YedE family protein [Paracoccaceae bacterium]
MIEFWLEYLGDGGALMLAGGLVGLIFGAAAQHSRFCLRAATVEVAGGYFGPRLAVWLLAFCSAVVSVQGAILLGWLDVSEARQLAATGSLSGALIGGALFGVGMVLARGCASRLLVLSATGNLRALVTGLVLTLVAQASLRGVLAPAREALAALWTVPGGDARDFLAVLGLGQVTAAWLALAGVVLAVVFAVLRHVPMTRLIAALSVGVAVALGWFLTYVIAQSSFDAVPIASVTFTGPSTDTLMGLVNAPGLPASFGVGLVPGVVLGAALMAVLTGEFAIERFGPELPMERYLIGACLMGFGAMLAGGCAVGAGLSGGSVMSLTALLAVFAMWLGATVTQWSLSLGPDQAVAGTP